MTINGLNLEYPLNIYSDLTLFAEENAQRCYYYHSVSTAMPHEPKETMDYLLSEFYSRRTKLLRLIELIYMDGHSVPEAAGITGDSEENIRELLYGFYRDMLYYPRYNTILTKGKQ